MFPAPGSPSANLYRKALEVLPGGSTRGSLYDMRAYVKSAKGCRVTDIDGATWLDASNNFMVLIHGHSHQPTIEAVRKQIENGLSFSLPAPPEVALAEHLCARMDSIDQIVFCNSGSEAVMHAMKAARALTKRPKIAKCEGLYHGSYDYAEVSNAPAPRESCAAPPSTQYGPYSLPNVLQDVLVIPFNDLEVSEQVIRANADQIAGIVVDPAPSRIGYIRATEAYLRLLRCLCDELGITLIYDEVASFRAAHGGSQSLFGVRPDITTLGKVIGGGMPVGAIGGTKEAMRIFDPSGPQEAIPYTGTFNAFPPSLAAGLATLEAYDAAAIHRLNELGAFVRSQVSTRADKAGLPVHVEGYASFVALFFSPRRDASYHGMAHTPADRARLKKFRSAALDRRLLIDSSGRFNLSTAYSQADAEELVDIVYEALVQAYAD